MLRLKANKTSLYNLVATYKPLPGMRRMDFQLYHEAHRLSVEGLRERGMVEEVTTAMERRRQAHGRA
mgnify:CR=1 FL=1